MMQSLFLCATILAFTCGVPLDKLGAELAKPEGVSDCLTNESKMPDGSCCDRNDIQFNFNSKPRTSCLKPRYPESCYMVTKVGTDLKSGEWVGTSRCSFAVCLQKASFSGSTYFAWTGEVYGGYCKIPSVAKPDLTTHQGYGYKLWRNGCKAPTGKFVEVADKTAGCFESETKMNDGSCCKRSDVEFNWDSKPRTTCKHARWPAPTGEFVEVADKTAVKDCQMYGNCGVWGKANCLTDEVVINPDSTDCSQETCCKSPDEFTQILHKSCSGSRMGAKYTSLRMAQSACKLEGHRCRGYYVSGCDFGKTKVYYKLCKPDAYSNSSSSCVFDKVDKDGCYVYSTDGIDLKEGEWVAGCSHCTFDACQDKARELSATYLAYTDKVYNGFCKVQMQNVTDPDLTTDQGYGYELFKFNENHDCSLDQFKG